jgi:hypothetical protein
MEADGQQGGTNGPANNEASGAVGRENLGETSPDPSTLEINCFLAAEKDIGIKKMRN